MLKQLLISLSLVSLTMTGCDDTDPPAEDASPDSEGDSFEPECRDEEDCDDAIDCTDDYCQGGRCRHTPHDEPCDDGRQCNGSETCDQDTGCAEGEPMVCDDHVDCTDDICDPDLDRCMSEPNHSRCTGGYRCDPSQDGCVPN